MTDNYEIFQYLRTISEQESKNNYFAANPVSVKETEELIIPKMRNGKGLIYLVSNVEIKNDTPLVEVIKSSGNTVCYSLPDWYKSWVKSILTSHDYWNSFPCQVEFSQLADDQYYVEFVVNDPFF